MLADAPFSNLDLISCRNLLIYLRPEIQDKRAAAAAFRPAAGRHPVSSARRRPSGNERNLFEPVSQKQRIFRRVGRRTHGSVSISRSCRAARAHLPPHRAPAALPGANLLALGQRALLDGYSPAAAMVDRRGDALFFFGPVDRFLRIPRGEASHNIVSMAREGLRAMLRRVIKAAIDGDGNAAVDGALRPARRRARRRPDRDQAGRRRRGPLSSS